MTKQDVINAINDSRDLTFVEHFCIHKGISQERARQFLQVVWATGNILFMQALMEYALKIMQNEFSISILYSKEGKILQVF